LAQSASKLARPASDEVSNPVYLETMTATKVISDRFKVSGLLAGRLKEHQVSVPAVLRRAGLPAGFFQQEKIYVTTAELFALWRAIGETSADPAIGLKLGAEPRFERYQPTAIAAVCSRTFRDALQRIARYKQITCPEEIRVRTSATKPPWSSSTSRPRKSNPM
jgi:hypothetical protein